MIAAVVLAAGGGSRFGGTKQLALLDGTPLVRHVVDAARDAGLERILVVVGHDGEAVATAAGPRIEVVSNDRWREGQSSSLRAGIDALGDDVDAALVLLADQPGITGEIVRGLLDAERLHPEPIVRLMFADAPGPTLLRRAVWRELAAIDGDVGARAFIDRHPDLVFEATIARAVPLDVDTADDLERLAGADHPGREKPPSL